MVCQVMRGLARNSPSKKHVFQMCSMWSLCQHTVQLQLEEAEAFLRAAGLDPAEVAKLSSSKDHKHKKSKKGHKHKDKQEKHKHKGKDRADKSPMFVD